MSEEIKAMTNRAFHTKLDKLLQLPVNVAILKKGAKNPSVNPFPIKEIKDDDEQQQQ